MTVAVPSRDAALPTVSVVVATRKRREMLRRFVGAVVAEPAVSEVIVVVDGDMDGSFELLQGLRLQHPTLRPLRTDHRGQLGALELGVGESRSEVVLLMDDDVVAGPGLAAGHARHHAQSAEAVVVGYMPVALHAGVSPATRLYAAEYEEHCRQLESGRRAVLSALWLGNVSVRRDALLRLGISSAAFAEFWHSDTDLGLRLEAAGLQGVFDRGLVAAHHHARSADAFLRDASARGRSAWMLEQEHPDRFDSAHTLPRLDDLATPLRQAVSFLAHGQRAQWSSRGLMAVGAGVERLGFVGAATRAARVARRVRIVESYRRAKAEAPAGRAAPAAARPAPSVSPDAAPGPSGATTP
jgi:GT2 family glycosyltransferase